MSHHLRNIVRASSKSELILLATYVFTELLDREIFMAATQAELQTALDGLVTSVKALEAKATANVAPDLQPQVDAVNALKAEVDAIVNPPTAPTT